MSKSTSPGRCAACGSVFNKAAMTRHLKSCPGTKDAAAAAPSRMASRKTFHLLVEGRYAPEYWLHLDVPAAATFDKLDQFLRRIWLECCGHMSAFTIKKPGRSVAPIFDPSLGEFGELNMGKKLGQVLSPGLVVAYEYDFGTTTALNLKVIAERARAGNSAEVEILARNDPPPIKCESCDQAATQVCTQCLWEGSAWFCEKCAKRHPCGEETLLPVVNSPRVGRCAYYG